MLEDTIIAVATPPGFGGLGIVRISGPRALDVAGRIFVPMAQTKKPIPDRRPIFGRIRDPEGGTPIDEAFLTYFKAPHSYTREDVVELSAHGSPAVLEAVMVLGVRAGARPARPGEFTLRACLNGRLDIFQAEAVNDLVRSVTLAQARISSRQLGGSLSRRVSRIRSRLVALLARAEAGLEFPDEGPKTGAAADLKTLASLEDEAGRLAATYETGKALAEGVVLAIVGRTNVGKSTLFNALLEDERAIVTPFPGTTRDFLREEMRVGGVAFHLVDMAGLGRPRHPAERRGVAKGREIARKADGRLLVFDASRPAGEEDRRLAGLYRGEKTIIVVNKTDLPRRLPAAKVRDWAGPSPVIEVSALKGRMIDRLRTKIGAVFAPTAGREDEIVLHARQKDGLLAIREAIIRARGHLSSGRAEELYAEELRSAVRLVGELAGEVSAEAVLEEIFGRFCVGK